MKKNSRVDEGSRKGVEELASLEEGLAK